MGIASQNKSRLMTMRCAALAAAGLMPLAIRAGSIFDDDYKPPPVHAPDHGSSTPNPSPQPSPAPAPIPEPTPPPAPRIKPTVHAAQKGLHYPLPIPSKAACAEAEKLVHDVFHDEYAKTTPADHLALGAKLLSEASVEANDPVTRYVLLRDAIDASETGIDPARALQGIEMLGRLFAVDFQSMKLDALALAARSPTAPWAAHAMTHTALILSEEALLAGRYELCVKTAQTAEALSRKSHEPGTMGWASDWVHDAEAVQVEAQRIAPLLAKMKEGTADGTACSDVGRFYCLFCGQWELGLPLLAKGGDASLKNLAEKELASSELLAAAQVSLGDLWLDAANKLTGFAKDSAQRRACYWYHLAEPNLIGLSKLTLSKRIRDTALPHMLHGLVADLYRGRFFESKFETRVDSFIDWDWNTYSPEPGLNRERFCIRWTGWLKAPVPGSYKILAQHDDGVHVYIDGKLVIDHWDGCGLDSAMVALGTDPVELCVEYFQSGGAASMGLGWVIPNAKRARAIPITAFLHEPIDMRESLPKRTAPDRDGNIALRAADVTLHGSRLDVFDTDSQIDHVTRWDNPAEWVSWDFTAPAGDYDVTINAGVDGSAAGGTYTINVSGAEIPGNAPDTGGWANFADFPVGRVHLAGGRQTLSVRAINVVRETIMNLHAVVLTPAKAE